MCSRNRKGRSYSNNNQRASKPDPDSELELFSWVTTHATIQHRRYTYTRAIIKVKKKTHTLRFIEVKIKGVNARETKWNKERKRRVMSHFQKWTYFILKVFQFHWNYTFLSFFLSPPLSFSLSNAQTLSLYSLKFTLSID